MESKELKDFFGFRKMISFSLLKYIYIVGTIVIIGWGISIMLKATTADIIAGVLTIILGSLFWRICCELWILFFSLHDLVKKTEKHLKILSDSIKG